MDDLHSFRYYIAGTTMFWVAMETHPELNEKIELMVLYIQWLPSELLCSRSLVIKLALFEK